MILITMSYIVEQNINGGIYLYEAESYWDRRKNNLIKSEPISDMKTW